MSLVLYHRRRFLQSAEIAAMSFDTVGTGTVFTIRRESDNVEQSFTYTEITDGTYDTFVSGSEGAVKEWIGNLATLSNTGTDQMRLKSNAGNPFLDDYTEQAYLSMAQTLDMSGDSVFSLIFKDELNNNNQRSNLVARGSGTNLFGLQLLSASGYVVYDQAGGAVNPDYSFPFSNDGLFKLLTFTRKSGVTKVYVNGVEITKEAGGTTYTIRTESTILVANTTFLGANGSGNGKVTKYRHVAIIVGQDATNLDVAAYNQDLMTKYGI